MENVLQSATLYRERETEKRDKEIKIDRQKKQREAEKETKKQTDRRESERQIR